MAALDLDPSLRSKVSDIIYSTPGLTSGDISVMIYGPEGDRFQVNQICRDLVSEGLVSRIGLGTRYSPCTYVWMLLRAAGSSLSIAAAVPALLEIQQSIL